MQLLYGLLTGVAFGFLLQKARVLRYDKQLGALRLQDFTIIKFMLSAIMVSMVGVHLLRDLGLVKLSLKPTIVGANLVGGLLFGLGWGLIGYCPGTAVGALGEGRWDAVWGLLGMLSGAAVFAEIYPWVKASLLTWGNYGKVTLPQLFQVNHWLIIAVFWALSLSLLAFLEKKGY